jgi:membrane protein
MTIISYTSVSSNEVLESLSKLLPNNAYEFVEESIIQAISLRSGGLLSLSIIMTLWAASNGVGAVIRGINKAYDIEESRPFWKLKGASILFTIALALMILFSFVLLIFGGQIGIYLTKLFDISEAFDYIWNIFRYLFTLFMMILIFAILYRYMPSKKHKWKGVLPGAIFSTLGWLATSFGFAYYVNNFTNYSYIYGSIGGVLVLLIWLFLSAIIIIMGGELNAVITFGKEGKEKPKGKKY